MMASKRVESGISNFSPQRYEGGGMRYLRFRRWLDDVIACTGDIGQVYFEEVRGHRGTDAAHIYGGLMAHLTSWCEERRIPYQGIPVGTIKKAATGKGNADKDAMIAEARRRGYNPGDDNEADALLLLEFIMLRDGHRRGNERMTANAGIHRAAEGRPVE
jgi:hypothetical protein